MTILELENRTGLERATIRYYEREGLIDPQRKENSYRDYSENDLQEILRIKLLRQLDLPLNQIKELQQGSAEITTVLRAHTEVLAQKVHTTERAAKICKEISDAAVTYQALDAAAYLEKIDAPEATIEAPAETRPKRRGRNYEYHPVRRLVARLTDYAIVRILIRFLLVVILRIRPFEEWMTNLLSYGTPFLCVPLMALSISKFGTTPGKWMMGIRTEALSGRRLGYQDALAREWNVLYRGYGFGIPFWSLWRMYKSYKEYQDWQEVEWDTGVDYHFTCWYVQKKTVFAGICAVLIALNCINAADVIKPKYRGDDLTVAQFAENYNFYANMFEFSTRMDSDGTWPDVQKHQSGNSVVIQFSKPEKENEPFHFETEGDRIHRITYANAWTDIQMLSPLGNNFSNAILTAVLSQRGVGIGKLQKFEKVLDEHMYKPTAHFQFENVEIRWMIVSENCSHSNGTYYADDASATSRVDLELEIVIHEID